MANRQVQLSKRPKKEDVEYILDSIIRNCYSTLDNYNNSNEPYYYKKGVVTGMWEIVDSINSRLQVLELDKKGTFQELVEKLETTMHEERK